MVKIEFNKNNTNPFFGCKACLNLYKSVSEQSNIDITSHLNTAWDEVAGDKEKEKMFYSLVFSIIDVTNRKHNIYKNKKVDDGGFGKRDFAQQIIAWLFNNNKKQFVRFLNAGLFNEFSCFDILFKNRVKTNRKGTATNITAMLADKEYTDVLLDYVEHIIRGTNTFNKLLVSKFLTLPRLSVRKGHKSMLPETKQVMNYKVQFLKSLSDRMGWEYFIQGNICNFKGYRTWRKEYNSNLESVLFSTGKIFDLDKEEFFKWYEQLPALARGRVVKRVNANSEKYKTLQLWISAWKDYKSAKQEEQRVLEEKLRQGLGTEEDVVKLEKVKKEAKVNSGATNFMSIYKDVCAGSVDPLAIEDFVANKVNLPYNTLVIVDDSGSMTGAPYHLATFIASVCLYKNPDDFGRSLVGVFDNTTKWYTKITKVSDQLPNYFYRKNIKECAPHSFIDPKKGFFENYKELIRFFNGVFSAGGTNIASIADSLKDLYNNNHEVLDMLKNYPLWILCSDCEWNNLSSPEASLNEFFAKCEKYLGFRPYIIAIDADVSSSQVYHLERFTGIENFMYVPKSPETIAQILANFKDVDVFDIYTPLLSIYRSNRYDVVRNLL